jgi:hypothetical protein
MAAGRLKLKQARDAAAAGVAAEPKKEVAPVKAEKVVAPVKAEKVVAAKPKAEPKPKPVAVVVAKLPNGCRPI